MGERKGFTADERSKRLEGISDELDRLRFHFDQAKSRAEDRRWHRDRRAHHRPTGDRRT
jgi:hypothetical protein